jgi:hypothetical protein
MGENTLRLEILTLFNIVFYTFCIRLFEVFPSILCSIAAEYAMYKYRILESQDLISLPRYIMLILRNTNQRTKCPLNMMQVSHHEI